MIQVIGQILVIVSAVLAVAVVAVYQALSRWWESPYGRHMFAYQAVVALCLSLWAARLFFPDGEWWWAARFAAFAGIPVVLAWRILIIVRAWREERALREKENLNG